MNKYVYLIDGSSFIYRAYYAIRHLSNSKGLPTNAIYGFIAMLDKLLHDENPEYIAICFDRKEATFRHEKYELYKAHRAPTPEDLIEQIPHIKDVVRAYNIPVIEKAGFEADDLLATLACMAEKKGLPVRIVTGDKDILQMVNDRIHILNVHKDGLVYDPEKVRERFDGLGAESVVDLMALTGDSSDNIPGVPGIGEKTAIKLIREYGSLAGVYDHLDALKGAQKKKLEDHKDLAFLSRELVTLDTNVPLDISLEALKRREKDVKKLTELFSLFEFKKLLRDILPDTENTTPRDCRYILITDEQPLATLVSAIMHHGACAVDTETTGINPHEATLIGISLSYKAHEAYYIPVVPHDGEHALLPMAVIKKYLGPLFENPAVKKYGQNIKFDYTILAYAGFSLKGIAFDTMVASYLLRPNTAQHNLDVLALTHLGIKKIPYESLAGKGKGAKTLNQVAIDAVCRYAAEDADCVMQLVPIFQTALEEQNLLRLFSTVEMPLIEVLAHIEMNGVCIDSAFLRRLSEKAAADLAGLEAAIQEEAGETFNINSPKQVADILFNKLKLPVIKKTKTGFSTDVSVLEALARHHTLPRLLLESREISKLKSTYLDALPELINKRTGLVHTSFNQTVTSTGRLSSSSPNVQNIPIKTESGRRIREAFIPRTPDGFILSADYSQIELRILAHLSHDKNLCAAFAHNEDVHTVTATHLYGCDEASVTREMRTIAKTINFSVIYGKTSYGLSQDLGIPIKEAAAFIDHYFATYSGVKDYLESIKEFARQHGYTETMLGRKCFFPDIHSRQQTVRNFAERAAVNAPIQGSAADLIKCAMIKIASLFAEKKFASKMILQVHDELVFDVTADEKDAVQAIVKTTMESALPLDVPLIADLSCGRNWAKQ